MGYTYDDASRLTGRTTTGTAGSGSQSYGYDRTGRLTSWTGADGTVTDYTWDAAGNRTGAGDVTAVYDERNRLLAAGDVTYTYSARGTRTGSSGPDGSHTAAFDAQGRMITSDGTPYAYDALGRLVEQGTRTLAYADQSNNLVSGGGQLVFRGPSGEALSSADADGTGAAAILSDQHGDVTGAFDPATGALDGSAGYSPFGEVTARTGATGTLGYQGEYTDPDTGRVNMHARWYDPATGGFSSRDTWTLNPVPSIAANRYGYGNGSPLLNTDPSGHKACLWGVCTPTWIDDGIREAERYANTAGRFAKKGARWVVRHPGQVARTLGKRLLGPVGWFWDFYTAGGTLGAHPCELPGGPPCGPKPRPKKTPGNNYRTGPYRGSVISPSGPGSGHGPGPGLGPGSGGCVYDCGNVGPPPPPPPPPWEDLIADALTTPSARPSSEVGTDTEHDEFVDDSLTKSLKELVPPTPYVPQDLGIAADYSKSRWLTTEDDYEFKPSSRSPVRRENCRKGNTAVHYMTLDSCGRAQGVFACLNKGDYNYVDSEKGTQSDWVLDSEDTKIVGSATEFPVNREHIPLGCYGGGTLHRGHLLARSLGGDGEDLRNLAPLYAKVNTPLMSGYESALERRVQTGETIYYQVTAHYEGKSPIAEYLDLRWVGSVGGADGVRIYNVPGGG